VAPKRPIIRQIAWLAVGFHLLVYATSVVVASLVLGRDSNPILAGVAPVFIYSLGSRYLVARSQRRGVRLMKSHDYDNAISHFEASYRLFSERPWLDRFRGVVLLSASAIPYREMALANIAFCHSQAGRVAEAKSAYERTISEFPESGIAQAALRMISSAETAGVSSGAA